MRQEKGQHKASPNISHVHCTSASRRIHEAVEHCMTTLNYRGAGCYLHLRTSQQSRLVHYLYLNGPTTTAELAGMLAIGNISDCVIKCRKVLNLYGLNIDSEPSGLMNRFDQRTPMHIWALVELREMAK